MCQAYDASDVCDASSNLVPVGMGYDCSQAQHERKSCRTTVSGVDCKNPVRIVGWCHQKLLKKALMKVMIGSGVRAGITQVSDLLRKLMKIFNLHCTLLTGVCACAHQHEQAYLGPSRMY